MYSCSGSFPKKHPCADREKTGSFFFFHQKSFCFVSRLSDCQTVEKTKKRIICARPHHHISALDWRTTHTFFSSPLLVFPRRRQIPLLKTTNLSSWCTLSSYEAFFLWWWIIRAWYIHRVRWRSRLKTLRRYAGEITFLVLVLLK